MENWYIFHVYTGKNLFDGITRLIAALASRSIYLAINIGLKKKVLFFKIVYLTFGG